LLTARPEVAEVEQVQGQREHPVAVEAARRVRSDGAVLIFLGEPLSAAHPTYPGAAHSATPKSHV
jgi:hypothetical protein